jgi:hypothetical protein
MKEPEHPFAPAFEQARAWEAQQETLLTEAQRKIFDDLKHKQASKLQDDRDRVDGFRKQLEERDRSKKPKAELALKPPILTRDPHAAREAQRLAAAERRHESLAARQAQEREDLLKTFEKARSGKEETSLTASWQEALAKTAKQKKGLQRDLGDDFDRGR